MPFFFPYVRLDSLVGLFGAGCQPSSTNDPFGLRRISYGLVSNGEMYIYLCFPFLITVPLLYFFSPTFFGSGSNFSG